MSRPFTVYFDTNFFSWLAGADDATAARIVDELNKLHVRHVLSQVLMHELLSAKQKPREDRVLVSRVGRLEIPPLKTIPNLKWASLLCSGDERATLAGALKATDVATAKADAMGVVATKKLSNKQIGAVIKAQLGDYIDEDFTKGVNRTNAGSVLAAVEKMINDQIASAPPQLASQLAPLLKVFSAMKENLDDPAALAQLLPQVTGMVSPDELEFAKERRRVQESVTAADARPLRVSTDTANARETKNTTNTFRDAARMHDFIDLRNEIDLLHVDRAQFKQIRRKHPVHRLKELGLDGRCFRATDLDDVVAKVKELAAIHCGGVTSVIDSRL